jgi:hypothetical protein
MPDNTDGTDTREAVQPLFECRAEDVADTCPEILGLVHSMMQAPVLTVALIDGTHIEFRNPDFRAPFVVEASERSFTYAYHAEGNVKRSSDVPIGFSDITDPLVHESSQLFSFMREALYRS